MTQPTCEKCGRRLYAQYSWVGGRGDVLMWKCPAADATGNWDDFLSHTKREVTTVEAEALRAGDLAPN